MTKKQTKSYANLNEQSTLKLLTCMCVCVCVCVCVHHCAQLSYTTQHRTVLIIVPLILQTIIIAQMMSTAEKGELDNLLTYTLKHHSDKQFHLENTNDFPTHK